MKYTLDAKIKNLFIDKGFTETMIAKKLDIPEKTVNNIILRLGLYEI